MFDLIAGTCAIETEYTTLVTAERLVKDCQRLNINLIYKGSYDKANRTSGHSKRGAGRDEGLRLLEKVKTEFNVPVLTDVHEFADIESVASVVDVLQTPAFLCRQTDFIMEVARQHKPVNIKKGQFLAPMDMKHVRDKAHSTGNHDIWLCERGTCFGYHDLVSDMRSLVELKTLACPVVYDATHSVQQPSKTNTSGGQRHMIAPLARAAVAVGIDKLFMECHPDPDKAWSDSATSYPLDDMYALLKELRQLHRVLHYETLPQAM